MTRLLRTVPTGVPLAIFLDYDGTLVPIRRKPELARLGADRASQLEGLSERACVGIVSGRPLAEIRRLVGIPRLAYAGNHGLELRARGRTWTHPEARRLARAVARSVSAIEASTSGFRGVFVENKGLTASVHFRLAAERHQPHLWALVADEVRRSRDRLVLSQGKKVYEIKPNVAWDKGRGVLELLRRSCGRRACYPVYIGDDRTDEDAFRALQDRGLTIRVGPGPRTLARFRLPAVDDVWEFLAALRARTGPLLRSE
jgi:trehalose-phosphatase